MPTETFLYPTKNSLPEDVRKQLVEHLNERLASLTDLVLQSKQAHWNIKGPQFIQLHLLLDELYDGVGEYADLVAERIAQLGGIADGTAATIEKRSTLDNYPVRPLTHKEHLLYVVTAIAQVASEVRNSVDWSDELGDTATADIFTEISRGLDVWLWKFESHTLD